MKKRLLTLIVFLLPLNCVNIYAQKNEKDILQTKLNNNEAVIWYLGHCGYAVKTKTKLLIFDYQENMKMPDRSIVNPPSNPSLFNGWINPEEIKDLDVVVFASHNHSDHFDQKIFNWESVVKKISYVFGWQEKEGRNYHSLPAPRKEALFDGLEIYTVNSHHSGVPESSFLVKVDGLTIYHNGDYIGKMGENAPSNIHDDMIYLKTKYDHIDLAFIGASTDGRLLEIMRSLNPKTLFPMHYGYREKKYKDFAADMKDIGEAVQLFIPEKKGDYIEYVNEKIVK